MAQHAFFFDESRCIDCRACSIACRDWHDIQPGPVKFLRRFTWEEGAFPDVVMHTLFAPCYHCKRPACVSACPSGALWKEDTYGAVLTDAEKCLGCRSCWNACPYGAPQFGDDGAGPGGGAGGESMGKADIGSGGNVGGDGTAFAENGYDGSGSIAGSVVGGAATRMSKCTMCADRLRQGHMPSCVNACPARALDFGPREEMRSRYGEIQALRDMPEPVTTSPSVIFKPTAPKRQVVPYDAERARSLFGQRGDTLPPLYRDNTVVTNREPGMVGKDRLNLKSPDPREALAATRSDEW